MLAGVQWSGVMMNLRLGWVLGCVLVCVSVLGLLQMSWPVSSSQQVGPTDCDQLVEDRRVGNAGCLVARPGAVAMVQQRFGGGWGLPGGTAEAGERAVCTAIRETGEEIGQKITATRWLHTLPHGFHIYLCAVAADAVAEDAGLVPQDLVEVKAAAWMDRQQRAAMTWRFPKDHAVVEQLIQQHE
jgi:ADP-ribose pyrophosphatase YjhB (NUDIX family)